MTDQYISLQEASKLTPYDANYLGLLVRKNRLPAIKQGGKWYTTKESILQYLDQVYQKSPSFGVSHAYPQTSLRADFTLVGTVFIPLMIIVAVAVFIFSEGVAAEKNTFKISQNGSYLGAELLSNSRSENGVIAEPTEKQNSSVASDNITTHFYRVTEESNSLVSAQLATGVTTQKQ